MVAAAAAGIEKTAAPDTSVAGRKGEGALFTFLRVVLTRNMFYSLVV